MKHRNDHDKRTLDDLLASHNAPPSDDMQASIARVAARLRADKDDAARLTLAPRKEADAIGSRQVRWLPAVAAAVLLVAAVGTAIMWPRDDSNVYRVVEGTVQAGDTIQTNDGGAQLALVDGSRVEMRAKSELSLERAEDGLRIRLNSGDIIVNAAKQRAGRLYVATKDITVSVVGTVFLVNADDDGSRVAVIEGEVRVQQGATETKLRPGEQVATGRSMTSSPIVDEIAWSRNAGNHRTLLQQSVAGLPAIAPRGQAERRDVFTVIAIRPYVPSEGSGRGGGPAIAGCSGGSPEIDPERFAFTGATLYAVIVWAYGTYDAVTQRCPVYSMLNLISGGPGWVRSNQWDIQAGLPPGAFGDAPRLRRMAQALLEDRFKVAIRRESRNVPAYALSLGRDASAYSASATETQWLTEKPERDGLESYKGVGQDRDTRSLALWGRNASVADLIPLLERLTGRPVIDRTGVKGQFNFSFWYDAYPDADGTSGGVARPLNSATLTSLISALRDRLGFRLENATSPVESLVIESADQPSEN